MQDEMLPPKGKKCHRTAFKLDCRHCVVEHGCELWVRVSCLHKDTGKPIDQYGCADGLKILAETQGVAQLTQQLKVVAGEVNALRLEVQGQQLQPVMSQIVDLNKRVAEARLNGADPLKLIESN